MNPGFARTAAILSAMTLGAVIPQAHVMAWGIRWLVTAMLFLVFLQITLSRSSIYRSHGWLVLANFGLGFIAWGLGGAVGGRDVALAAFFAGITPTAIAAPVIVSFLHGRVEYVVAAFFLTNITVAAALPLLLPLVLGKATPEAFGQVLGSVGLVVFAPMLLAWCVRKLYARAKEWPARLRDFSFGMWVTAIFLITANASHFVRSQSEGSPRVILEIAGVTLVICALNFAVGWLLGGRDFRREGSQSLGQKNTTFTIYLALTYTNPLVALGPTCYVVWHNLWNSWQLHRAERATVRRSPGREES